MSDPGGYFITGTDTGVGKTIVTLGLMRHLQAQGKTVFALKPVATGCERTAAGLRNEDALQLQRQASVRLDYEQINPYAFEPPIAPHIAAGFAGVRIEFDRIRSALGMLSGQADCVLVEGIGGWQVPLDDRQTMADLARVLALPVILVAGIRLGCLNHALLTAAAIEASGLRLAGWVANCIPPRADFAEDNINYLKSMISAPLLGVIPVLSEVNAGRVAGCLSLLAAG
jgi:dethiobiotin synthetase